MAVSTFAEMIKGDDQFWLWAGKPIGWGCNRTREEEKVHRQKFSLCPLSAMMRAAFYTMMGLSLWEHEPGQSCQVFCYGAGKISHILFPRIQRMSCLVQDLSGPCDSGKEFMFYLVR